MKSAERLLQCEYYELTDPNGRTILRTPNITLDDEVWRHVDLLGPTIRIQTLAEAPQSRESEARASDATYSTPPILRSMYGASDLLVSPSTNSSAPNCIRLSVRSGVRSLSSAAVDRHGEGGIGGVQALLWRGFWISTLTQRMSNTSSKALTEPRLVARSRWPWPAVARHAPHTPGAPAPTDRRAMCRCMAQTRRPARGRKPRWMCATALRWPTVGVESHELFGCIHHTACNGHRHGLQSLGDCLGLRSR